MALVQVIPPAVEPIGLAEAKAHLRVTEDAEDDLIAALIAAARETAEAATGRSFITQSWRLTLDRLPPVDLGWWDGVREGAAVAPLAGSVELPRPPLQTITAVEIIDEDGAASLWPGTEYFADTAGARLVLRRGRQWPEAARAAGGIVVTYAAGYGDAAADVPAALRQGILAQVARLYEHRGDDAAAETALSLWRPYRVVRL